MEVHLSSRIHLIGRPDELLNLAAEIVKACANDYTLVASNVGVLVNKDDKFSPGAFVVNVTREHLKARK